MSSSLNNSCLLPVLHKKYAIILISTLILGVLLPFTFHGVQLVLGCAMVILLALPTSLLYSDFRWQKLYRKLRPYVVTRILQVISIIFFVIVLIYTMPRVMAEEKSLLYIVFWLISGVIVYEFFSIFKLAHTTKKQRPDVCELLIKFA